MLAALDASLAGVGGNGIRFARNRWTDLGGPSWFVLAEEELASVFPGPASSVSARRASRGSHAWILPIGRTLSGSVVGPEIEPEQGRHAMVLGETGMGKSSLLVALTLRAARSGSVVLFDPMGDTARSLAGELGPRDRSRLLRLFAAESSARLNALDGIGPGGDPIAAERRLHDLVHALRRVRAGRYVESGFWGPRLEEMLTRSLGAAAALPRGTLADAHALLASGGRARRDLPAEAVGPVRELADRIRERPEDAEGARRLLHEVVRSTVLDHWLCDPEPALRPADLVARGRITVISGDAAQVGENNARYLLAVLLALVWSELIGRPSHGKTFVVLDEAQWFAHESLAEMLRLGRRSNVHVVLATQAVASLPESVREAVWTNVADIVAFRGSPEEARELARVARAVDSEALLGLPRGHAVALIGKGQDSRWIRTARLPRAADPPPSGGGSSGGSRGEIQSPGPTPSREDLPPLAASPMPPPVLTVEEVLSCLRRRAVAGSPGSLVRIHLDELRGTRDLGGLAVRLAGRRLTEAGALERGGRDEQGRFWEVRPDRIPPRGDAGPSERPPDVTSPGKPS